MANKQVKAVLLEGNWHYRRATMQKIFSKLGEHDRYTIEGEESFAYVSNQVYQNSCFGETRVFVFNEWPLFDCTKQTFIKRMIELVDKTPDDTLLIFNNVSKMTDKFKSHIAKVGKTFEDAQHLKPQEAERFVLKEFANREKQIDKSLAEAIVETIGSDDGGRSGVNVDKLLLIISKICTHIGNRKKVSEADVSACCSHSASFVVFNLMNKLDKKEYESAIDLLVKALPLEKDVRNLFEQVINLMYSRYTMLLFLKEFLHNNNSLEKAKQSCVDFKKLHKSYDKYLIQYRDKAKEGDKPTSRFSGGFVHTSLNGFYGNKPAIQCYSRKELVMVKRMLGNAREKTRSDCTDGEMLLMLEMLVGAICGKVSPKDVLKIMELNDGILV